MGRHYPPQPEPGEATLLVYRVGDGCECWCATGEGDRAPLCAEHGNAMMPLGHPPDTSDQRLGFVGRLQPEAEALAEIRKEREFEEKYALTAWCEVCTPRRLMPADALAEHFATEHPEIELVNGHEA